MTEQEMRECKAPTPKSTEELSDYIDGLIGMQHNYGTCVYAMSLAATAAFNHVASKLGVTGFQANCADLDVIRRTRNYEGPFMLVDAQNMLYPQYDLHKKLDEAIAGWRPWAKEQAQKKLAESDAHPDVVAHWKSLTT